VIDGPEKGKSFALGQSNLVMVGRDHSCTFQIMDPRLSRVHLQVKLLGDGRSHAAIDFQSSNGVFLNDSRIAAETPLAPGDLIRIGDTVLVYSSENDPKAVSIEEHLRRLRQGAMTTQLGD
jgi:pSer/pThr/pTyr-binding forkhead associated (FHA) protein